MAVPAELSQKAEVPGLAHVRVWGDETPGDIGRFAQTYLPNIGRLTETTRRPDGSHQADYLVLSGGAGDGAFGAGVLSGWSRRGTRPQFAVVTGVSAGALIAPFAFLGPRYDPQLRKIWTQYETKDLVITNVISGLLSGEALADTGPLEALIEEYVSDKVIDAVAAEYRRGRMLLIGTTNLDAQRPVIWNMGEIALRRDKHARDLFRKVLLASASVPGAFPPVRINVMAGGKEHDEMHVDGGPTRQVFLGPGHLTLNAFDRFYERPPKRRVFVIKNGKLTPEYEIVKAQTIAISTRALYTTTKSQSVGDLARIREKVLGSASAGGPRPEFQLISIPPDFNVPSKEPFDKAYMQALFKTGFALGMSGSGWAGTVPEGVRVR
ncbi:MAG TPA: patatin-like phospholipase family protein [Hyphomicrobiaceae bacterium]|nr:patatin-like phospholipase family protein [Hyphomicrobiaceae bacterium]